MDNTTILWLFLPLITGNVVLPYSYEGDLFKIFIDFTCHHVFIPAEFYCVKLFRPSLVREDQGGCAGALRCGKGTNWEGGQRVPALVSYPGKISPGKSHTLASTLDIFPTIASIIKNSSGHNNADMGRVLNEDVGYDLTRSLLKDEQVNKCTNIDNSSNNEHTSK